MKLVIVGSVESLSRYYQNGRGWHLEVKIGDNLGTVATLVVEDREDARAYFRIGASVSLDMKVATS